jgi:hypothetical protein
LHKIRIYRSTGFIVPMTIQFLKRLTCLSFLLLGLSACHHLPECPVQGEFDGVKASLDRSKTVSMFIVHGMGEFSEGDPDTLIRTLTEELCLDPKGGECLREIANTDDKGRKVYGHLRRQTYYSSNTGHHLRIYVLHWDDATACEKNSLQRLDDNSYLPAYRMPMIQSLKERFVTVGVVDAGFYLAHYGPEIQFPFAQSIRWIYDDAKNDPCHEVIVVSFSLGNTIVVDTLDAMRGMSGEDLAAPPDAQTKLAAEEFIKHMSAFFMQSNSYPLFELASLPSPITHYHLNDKNCCDDPAKYTEPGKAKCALCEFGWQWEKSSLGRFMQYKRSFDPSFQIISINDPNDLFGFAPEGYYVPAGCKDLNIFLNENVRNVSWAYFGIVNPAEAHTGYGKNANVLGMIIYGVNDASCAQ